MENIELRSSKVRNIIGEVPPHIVRYGNTILGLLICLLFLAGIFIPLPWSNIYFVYIKPETQEIFLPPDYVNAKETVKNLELTLNVYRNSDKPSLSIHIFNVQLSKDTIINKKVYRKGYFNIKNDITLPYTKELLDGMLKINYQDIPVFYRFKVLEKKNSS